MSKKKEAQEQPEVLEEQPEVAQEQTAPEELPTEPTAEEKFTALLQEEKNRNLRLMAEFDNFRKRAQKEKESIYPDAVADTIKELLPLLDNFQRALEAPSNDEEYKKGVRITYNGFMDTLKKLGVAEFGEAGETFDPNLHNAVMHVEDESLGVNVLSQVFQRGYKLGERVLRYAMVQTAN